MIDAIVSSPAKLTVAPQQITFTPADFPIPQALTLSGLEDLDDADETLRLVLVSSIVPTTTISVTVVDDD